jgi:hypothetical protein
MRPGAYPPIGTTVTGFEVSLISSGFLTVGSSGSWPVRDGLSIDDGHAAQQGAETDGGGRLWSTRSGAKAERPRADADLDGCLAVELAVHLDRTRRSGVDPHALHALQPDLRD